jgi:hypothetical protein
MTARKWSMEKVRDATAAELTVACTEVVGHVRTLAKPLLFSMLGVKAQWDKYEVMKDSILYPILKEKADQVMEELMKFPFQLTSKEVLQLRRAAKEAFFNKLYWAVEERAREKALDMVEEVSNKIMQEYFEEEENDPR